jgi:GPH family glycoside/pentoside/hexuronide:cation symporter
MSDASSSTASASATQRPSLAEKLLYGAGNVPGTVTMTATSFLLFFYTDVAGIAAAAAGTLLLAVKIWDAIWDIAVGRYVDRTRTRFGQCRPWLLMGAVLFPITLAMTFYAPHWPGAGSIAWAALSFIALQMTFSVIMIPYQSLPVLMTDEAKDRGHLAGSQALWTFATVMLVNGGTMALVGVLGHGDAAHGFLSTMTLLGVIAGAFLLILTLIARERIPAAHRETPDLRADLGTLFRHPSWRSLTAVKLLFTVGLSTALGATIYYVTVVLGQPALIGPVMGINALGLILGVPFSLFLTRRVCPKRVAWMSFAAAAILPCGFAFMSHPMPPAVMVLNALIGLAIGTSLPAFGPSIPNMVDHVELDTGHRLMGLGISTLNFAEKVGGGIAGGLSGAVLAYFGYVGGAPTQSPATVHGVVLLYAFGPAVFFGLAAIVFARWFPLDRVLVEKVRERLQAVRAAS